MRKLSCRITVLILICIAAVFPGCSRRNGEIAVIEKDVYEPVSRRTVEVKKGDLQPVVRLTLQVEGYERVLYGATADNLQLDKLHVAVGDKVKAGDLLVSFKSENLDKTMASYEQKCNDNRLLIEHLRNLMEIDSEADYAQDIKMLEEDILVAELYMEETKAKLMSYQIVARNDGTIVKINDLLKNGYFIKGHDLVTQVCGTGNYTAKTQSKYQFRIGDAYKATAGIFTYELKVSDIQPVENISGRMEQLITFEPVSDMSAVSDAETLTMVIEEPVRENVVYVEASAVHETDYRYFVYLMDEYGYRRVVWVETGDKVDSYMIITDGLEGGEKVCLD